MAPREEERTLGTLTARVRKVTKANTVNDDPYLRVKLDPGGFAVCFFEELFERLWALEGKGPVRFDISESDKTDGRGKPFMRIEGIEHPGQTRMAGT